MVKRKWCCDSLSVHRAQDLGLEVVDVLADLLDLGGVLSEASCASQEEPE